MEIRAKEAGFLVRKKTYGQIERTFAALPEFIVWSRAKFKDFHLFAHRNGNAQWEMRIGGKDDIQKMENRENLHEWEKMLGESETLHLAVVEQSGYPMVYPMEKVSSVGLEQVLFITKKQSEKYALCKNASSAALNAI